MNKDYINDMGREELISLIKSLIIERENTINPINKISVCDVEVSSNVESLNYCKDIVNDLIKTNKEFITLRKNKLKVDNNLGYID